MFKKLYFTAVMTTVMIFSLMTANAENGDVCGKIYSTDILALVNGQPIESYNIGGKTVVLAEDLYDDYDGASYGFYVTYHDENRLLSLDSYLSNINQYYFDSNEKSIERGKVGTVLGEVYDTDIKVVCNNHEITGYNIGGKTAICIEDLGMSDDSINSRFGYSKYLANFTYNEETRTVELNTPFQNISTLQNNLHSFNGEFAENVLTLQHDPLNDYFNQLKFRDDKDSESPLSDYFVLNPFYIEINGEKHEVGVCFRSSAWADGAIFYHIKNIEETTDLLMNSINPQKTYEEAMNYLYSHPNYTISQRLDNDDYTILTLLEKETEGNIYVAVRKTGGYLKFADYSQYSDRTITITLEGHVSSISMYPFTGPHGVSTTMRADYNLADMQF